MQPRVSWPRFRLSVRGAKIAVIANNQKMSDYKLKYTATSMTILVD
jgi:hypothetical protein